MVYFEAKLRGSYNRGRLIFLCAIKDGNKNDVNTLLKNSTQQSIFGASMQVKVVNDVPQLFGSIAKFDEWN